MVIIKDKILAVLTLILVVVMVVFAIILIRSNNKTTDTKDSSTVSIEKHEEKKKFNTENYNKVDKYNLSNFYLEDKILEYKVDSILSKLSEREKIGQMIIVAAGRYGKPYEKVEEIIKSKELGGVLLLKGDASEFKSRIKSLSKLVSSNNALPLIFSCDAEPSLINDKIIGSPQFPETSAISVDSDSYKIGEDIAKYIKGLGFHQNYAPVCDFSSNKEIIGNRSYGNSMQKVAPLANAFIKATQNQNVIATAKHFPGHGRVSGDSHEGLVTIKGNPAEIETFKSIIDNGVISIMVGHIAVTESDKYGTDGKPSTLSKNIITNILKSELKFRGLIVTDAMNMKAVSGLDKPSFMAIKSGCDMVIMPSNEKQLIDSVVEECKKDKEFEKQINDSVKKIIKLKFCLGLL